MRRIPLFIAVIAAATVGLLRWGAGPGREDPGRVAAATVAAPRPAERLQMRILAERYGLSEAALAQMRQEGTAVEDLALAANLSLRGGLPLAAVLKARKAGEEWSAIAKRLGIREEEMIQPASALLPKEDETLIREMLQRRFGLSELIAARLRQEGFPAAEIVLAAEITGGGDANVAEALYAHRGGKPWQAIAARFPERMRAASAGAAAPRATRESADEQHPSLPGRDTPSPVPPSSRRGGAGEPGHRPGAPEPERRGGA